MLFLAISSALSVVVFVGFGQRTRTIQFSEGMRAIQSHVLRQRSFVFSGVNSRAANNSCDSVTRDPGQADACVVLGRYLDFNAGSTNIQSIVVIGDNPTTDPTGTTADQIAGASPKATETSTYGTDWGIEFIGGKATVSGSDRDASSLGFMRSPYSTGLNTLIYTDNPVQLDRFSTDSTITDYYLCFQDTDGRLAALRPGSSGDDAVMLDFEAVIGDCSP